MKGTIRIVAGFLMLMGGVGGIEASMEPGIPMDSLAIAVAGLAIFGWGALSAAANETFS
jgi:hypothetical protein